jgi:hypothetical protein
MTIISIYIICCTTTLHTTICWLCEYHFLFFWRTIFYSQRPTQPSFQASHSYLLLILSILLIHGPFNDPTSITPSNPTFISLWQLTQSNSVIPKK